jgi:membrane-associated protein
VPGVIGIPQLALSSPISYLIAFLFPALDAIFPLVPSETVIIALGVATAGSADPRIAVLVGLAACGAFAGDNFCYFLGRRFGPAAERRLFSGERGQRRRAWATGALERFGARLIVVCRFIPGGRTAVTLTCGVVGYPYRKFALATAGAGLLWASYAFLLGRLGGTAFEDQPWIGFLVAFGITLAATGLIELVRRLRPWRWLRRADSARADSGRADSGRADPPPATPEPGADESPHTPPERRKSPR